MKGGPSVRFWGRQSSFTIAVILFTVIFFWSWESNPNLVNLLSKEEPFLMNTPDLFADDSAESSFLINPNKHLKEGESISRIAKDKPVVTGVKHLSGTNILPAEEKDENTVLPSQEKNACNYGKGKWVEERRRPLYSGFECKQWLSDMWACRLTNRTNFSYEAYRWQPSDCNMPEFDSAEFFRKMQNKTLAFIGDSLGRQQFQSLMCMITGGKEVPQVEDISEKYGLSKPEGAIRPDGWAYLFPETNTTILYYWSASLCDIEPLDATNPSSEVAMHLDRPPSFLNRFLPQFDVVILNTGHHWNRGKLNANRWVMYANGEPVVDRKLARMADAKNLTLHSLVWWLDSQISSHPDLKVFLRTISPRHFSHGEWNTGGSCDNVIPMSKGNQVIEDGSSDPVVADAVRGSKVKLLDITALSELRDEAHISRNSIKASDGIHDCLHWCLPGIPDTWNELVYAQL